MKKIILLLFCALSISLTGNNISDSLILKLKYQKEDTNKVELLNAIGFELRRTNPKEGLEYGQMALELSNKLKFSQGIAHSHTIIALNYKNMGKSDMAIINYKNAIGGRNKKYC